MRVAAQPRPSETPLSKIVPPGPRASRPRRTLSAVALAAALMLVAWSTSPAEYAALDFLGVATAYCLLAWAIHSLAPLGRRFGLPGEMLHALVPGVVFAWHLREQTRPPGVGATLWTLEGALPFLAWSFGAAGVYWLLSQSSGDSGRDWRPVRTIAATVSFLLVWGALHFVSPTTRWHMLNHNRMLGTPAYHLFSEPTREIEHELWDRRMGPVPTSAEGPSADLAEVSVEAATNVVVVLLDTMRADSLAAWGGAADLMPLLNDRARDAWVFSNVLSNSSWTRPSVGSLFTGLLPEEHGAVGWEYVLASDRVTLAEVFAEAGYETAGRVANRQAITPEVGFDQGFDSYAILRRAPNPYARADEVNESVAAWLSERRARARTSDTPVPPAFLYVHFLDPHTPYLVAGDRYLHHAPTSHVEARNLYDQELRFLDGHLEKLFEMLYAELGSNTAILVTSDHGEEFGEHGQRGHGHSLYRDQLEIPALVWLPSAEAGRSAARLEIRDLFDLTLRLRDPANLDIGAWAERNARDTRYASLSGSKDPGPSQWLHDLIRPYRNNILMRLSEQGSERLIWSAYGDTYELYDLDSDPEERTNLARQRPASVERLARLLEAAPRWWAPRIVQGITEDALEELRTLGYIQ